MGHRVIVEAHEEMHGQDGSQAEDRDAKSSPCSAALPWVALGLPPTKDRPDRRHEADYPPARPLDAPRVGDD